MIDKNKNKMSLKINGFFDHFSNIGNDFEMSSYSIPKGKIGGEVHYGKPIVIRVINYKEKFSIVLNEMMFINAIKFMIVIPLQRLFRKWYYSPDNRGGKTIVNRLNEKKITIN